MEHPLGPMGVVTGEIGKRVVHKVVEHLQYAESWDRLDAQKRQDVIDVVTDAVREGCVEFGLTQRSVLAQGTSVHEAIKAAWEGIKARDEIKRRAVFPGTFAYDAPGVFSTTGLSTFVELARIDRDAAAAEATEYGEFTCPECGSHRYGTSNATGPVETWMGHCNGFVGDDVDGWRGCPFSWPRADDDRYFKGKSDHVPGLGVTWVASGSTTEGLDDETGKKRFWDGLPDKVAACGKVPGEVACAAFYAAPGMAAALPWGEITPEVKGAWTQAAIEVLTVFGAGAHRVPNDYMSDDPFINCHDIGQATFMAFQKAAEGLPAVTVVMGRKKAGPATWDDLVPGAKAMWAEAGVAAACWSAERDRDGDGDGAERDEALMSLVVDHVLTEVKALDLSEADHEAIVESTLHVYYAAIIADLEDILRATSTPWEPIVQDDSDPDEAFVSREEAHNWVMDNVVIHMIIDDPALQHDGNHGDHGGGGGGGGDLGVSTAGWVHTHGLSRKHAADGTLLPELEIRCVRPLFLMYEAGSLLNQIAEYMVATGRRVEAGQTYQSGHGPVLRFVQLPPIEGDEEHFKHIPDDEGCVPDEPFVRLAVTEAKLVCALCAENPEHEGNHSEHGPEMDDITAAYADEYGNKMRRAGDDGDDDKEVPRG